MSEKLKTQSGAVYELTPNGAYFADDTAKVIFVFPEDKTYEQIESDIEGNDRLLILDADGQYIEAGAISEDQGWLHLPGWNN